MYTKGSCYENVVYDATTGKSENVSSLSEAVAIASKNANSEINIIVNKITVDNSLELTSGTNLTINALKEAQINGDVVTKDDAINFIKNIDYFPMQK